MLSFSPLRELVYSYGPLASASAYKQRQLGQNEFFIDLSYKYRTVREAHLCLLETSHGKTGGDREKSTEKKREPLC